MVCPRRCYLAAAFARAEVGGKGIDPHLAHSPARFPLARFRGLVSQDHHGPSIKAALIRVASTSKQAHFFWGRAIIFACRVMFNSPVWFAWLPRAAGHSYSRVP